MSAELDYAFLAEWAKVSPSGLLTAVDASFLRVLAPVGSRVNIAVAGRVRFLSEPFEANLEVAVNQGNHLRRRASARPVRSQHDNPSARLRGGVGSS